MNDLITRKEARTLGLTIGRMDYLLKCGKLEYEPNTKLFSKTKILEFASRPPRSRINPPKPRVVNRSKCGPYMTKSHYRLALKALKVCSKLMGFQAIKAQFADCSTNDLLAAAQACKNKLKVKESK